MDLFDGAARQQMQDMFDTVDIYGLDIQPLAIYLALAYFIPMRLIPSVDRGRSGQDRTPPDHLDANLPVTYNWASVAHPQAGDFQARLVTKIRATKGWTQLTFTITGLHSADKYASYGLCLWNHSPPPYPGDLRDTVSFGLQVGRFVKLKLRTDAGRVNIEGLTSLVITSYENKSGEPKANMSLLRELKIFVCDDQSQFPAGKDVQRCDEER